MKTENGNKFTIIGKVDNINITDRFKNVDILTKDGNKYNIIILQDIEIQKLRVYEFSGVITKKIGKDKLYYEASSVEDISNYTDKELMYKYYRDFYNEAPCDFKKIKIAIEEEIDKISNKPIKDIVLSLYNDYKDKFFTHPAGTKFHHAYIGGLIYHTYTMLEMAKKLLKVYTFLNSDLLIAGIIIHDIEKVNEITSVDGEYTKEGQLIGHINMGAISIDRKANELGYKNLEEVMCLKHLILAHHGIPNYGSPKKPQMAEAMLLWYIDTIDSKLCVIGEELRKIKPGNFTQPIFVADKIKMYKPAFSSKKK